MLNVIELIKLLKTCDPKANVCLASNDECTRMCDLYEIQYDDKNIYLVPHEAANEYWEMWNDKRENEIYKTLSAQGHASLMKEYFSEKSQIDDIKNDGQPS